MRTELTTSDITEAKLFTFVASPFLSDYGADVREESNTQVSHYLHMENFPLKLKKLLTQSTTISTSVTVPLSFLQDAASLYDFCPEFRDSLIVALLKASINRTMGNGKKVFNEKVINFYRFVKTFSPQAAEVVSAKIRGPGQRWVLRINNSEVQDCIFDVTHDTLVAIMKKTAVTSAVGPGVPVNFYLAINETKSAKVLEVSASHKAIIGRAFPNHAE